MREKEYNNTSNVLLKTGSDFCTDDSFPGTFTHFRFMIFTQERISTYVAPLLQILQLKDVFQMTLPMCLVNVKKVLWLTSLTFFLISNNFQNSTFEIITITTTEIVLIQVFLFAVGSKQKNKNENKKYHSAFIPFKSQLD